MGGTDRELTRRIVAAAWVPATLFAVYASTVAPGLLYHDSGEFQTVAAIGGIPHTTGYPTFVLVGRVFCALLPGDVAWRANMVSVVCGAATVASLMGALVAFGIRLRASALTALAFGLSFTFWRSTQRAEVYTLATLAAALALWTGLLAWRTHRPWPALLSALFMGLAICSHMSYAPAAALAGIALAVHVARTESRRLLALVLLACSFLLGLSPYLYIAWADGRHVPANFLDHAARLKELVGSNGPPLDSAWDRIRWLVMGGNFIPPRPFVFEAGPFLRMCARGAFDIGAFELGPLAMVAALAGLVREWRARAKLALVLAAGALLAGAFAAAVGGEAVLPVLLLPSLLLLLPFVARGAERGLEMIGGVGGVRWVAGFTALLALFVVPPHALRRYAERHPLTRERYQMLEEGGFPAAGWIPSLASFRDAEAYSREVLTAAPESAFVMARWNEYNPLRFEHLVRHQRPDIRIELAVREGEVNQARGWRLDARTRHRPIVLTHAGPALDALSAEADSVSMPGRGWLYVLRAPLDADARRFDAREDAPSSPALQR